MHLYTSSVGFSKIKERDFIDWVQKNNALQSADYKDYSRNIDRGFALIPVSKNTALYSTYLEGEIKTIAPMVEGIEYDLPMEIEVERHSMTETFSVCTDGIKTGATIIFYLVNTYDYLINSQELEYDWNVRNTLKALRVKLGALAVSGMVLLPVSMEMKYADKYLDALSARKELLKAAKDGDEQAMESLTIEDLDTYAEISRRITHEDVFTIVDSSFMPIGVECDIYSVVGEILSVEIQENTFTKEEMYVMELDCNDLKLRVAINVKNLLGEPSVGRRFKGQIWLHGEVVFNMSDK